MKPGRGLLILCLLVLVVADCVRRDHPDDLKFLPLKYDPPVLKDHRSRLKNGVTVFLVEDNKLPVVDIQAVFRTGSLKDPETQDGLARLTAGLLRTGGTATIKSDSLDELLDFHALGLGSDCDMTGAEVSISMLSHQVDLGLDLFNRVLRNPAFEQEKIALAKSRLVESIRHRFDHPKISLRIIYDYAIYGPGPISRLLTEKEVGRISRAHIRQFYRAHYRPENLVLAVSGRFDTKEMLNRLNATLGIWKGDSRQASVFPEVASDSARSFTFVEKNINQAYIRMGLPLFKRPHPDFYSLALMNWILGGASFTSRISKKIREHEGLAYHAGSSVRCGYFYPGSFNVYLETKSQSAAYAVQLVMDEINKFLESGALKEELEAGKQSLIDAFPAMFKTGQDIADAFLFNHYRNRSDDHYAVYRDKLRAITLDDIHRVAKVYIKPAKLSICMVGKYADCIKGDGVHKSRLTDFGKISVLSEKEVEALCTRN